MQLIKKTAGFATVLAVCFGANFANAGGLGEPDAVQDCTKPCQSTAGRPSTTLGFFGGQSDGNGFAGLSGSIYLPSDTGPDLQFDADLGRTEDGIFGQIAGHIALQSYEHGLAGAYVAYSNAKGGTGVWRLGAEAYADLPSASLSAVVGWQSEGKNNLFFDGDVAFAITPSTQLSVGYAYDDGSVGKVRIQHDLTPSGTSSVQKTTLYLEGRAYEGGNNAVLAGIDIQFGAKSASYCPPAAEAPRGFKHWNMSRQSLRQSTVAFSSIRACTDTDLPPGTIPLGCVGTAKGNVVNGDTSQCEVDAITCD